MSKCICQHILQHVLYVAVTVYTNVKYWALSEFGCWCAYFHRKSRATFDNTEVRKEFGPVMVHYGNVQKKVNDKYDMWHKEVVTKLGGMLGQSMQDFHATVTKVG